MAQIPRSNQVPGVSNTSYMAGHGGGYPQQGFSQPIHSQTPHHYENISPHTMVPQHPMAPQYNVALQHNVGPQQNMHTVKYPPSMDPAKSIPMPASSQVPVPEISKQFDFATKESKRLKQALEENNSFLELKLQELAKQSSALPVADGKDQEIQELKKRVSEATNRFFEARVAVMGYKCQVLQLQGQLEKKQHEGKQQEGNPGHSKELRVLRGEQENLLAVQSQLKEDLESLGNKKSIAEEERDRMKLDCNTLRQQLHDKEVLLQQLQMNRMSSHDHTLQGQIQELQRRKASLEGEVSRTKLNNDKLLEKVKEMQQSRDIVMQKLERLENRQHCDSHEQGSMSSPRMPSSSSEELQRLQEEIASITTERNQLRAERDRANQDKLAVDAMFQGSNRKSQNLTEENLALQHEIQQLKEALGKQEQKVQQLEVERLRGEEERSLSADMSETYDRAMAETEKLQKQLQTSSKEKTSLVSKVSRLEREKEQVLEELEQIRQAKEHLRSLNQKNRNRIAQLEERVAANETVAESAELKSYTTMKAMNARRLNDALGEARKLQLANANLKEELEELKETQTRRERQFQFQLRGLEEDLEREREEGMKVTSEDLSLLQSENARMHNKEQQQMLRVRQLEGEQQRLVEESLKMRKDLDRYRQDLAQDDSLKRDLNRQVSDRESEVARLTEQVRGLQDQLESEAKNKSKNFDKLETLQQNFSEMKLRLQAENEDKQTRLQILTQEKQHILSEKEELQGTCEEFRKESESILADYDACAQRLKIAEDAVNRMTVQRQQDMTEQTRLRERISLLEKSRKEQDDKLNHMDQQIKIYHEDFDRERNAREAAVKVKNLAEDRMKKMDRELKDLRDRLNQQAVRSLRDDQFEDGSYSSSSSHLDTMSPQRYSDPHNKSGEQYPASQPPTAWNAPAPSSGSGPLHHHTPSHGSQEQRRSGEVQYDSGAALPPVSGYAAAQRPGPYRAGAGGQWTTITPASSQPAHYHHSNKTTLDRTLEPTADRTMEPLPQGRRDQIDYNQSNQSGGGGGGMNDINNPPVHVPDTGMNVFPPNAPPRMSVQEHHRLGGLEPAGRLGGVDRPGGMEPVIGAGGQPLITLPGEVNNTAPPTMACPICNRDNFKTQTELEIHSAQCIVFN